MTITTIIKKALVVSLALVAPVGIYFAAATYAAPNTAQTNLIDKEIELCTRKIAAKRFYNRIEATAEQRTKLDEIMYSTMDGTRPAREELRHGMLDLSALVASDDATDEQIVQKAHELRAVHEKVNDQRLESLLKARKVLTHDQRQKLNEHITDFITGGIKPRKLSMMFSD